MRARNIKPGFYKNDVLGCAAPLTRILFSGLWCLADREGRLCDRPLQIKAEILPYDNVDCDEALSELERLGFIVRYEVDGVRYIQIVSFFKHQTPSPREKQSEIPPFFECDEKENVKTLKRQCQDTEKAVPSSADILITDIRNTDTPLTEKAEEVLCLLEEKNGKEFRDRKAPINKIKQAMNRGFTADELKAVVTKMCDDWKGTKYERYLTPSTLFGDKLEEYVNRPLARGQPKNASYTQSHQYTDEDIEKIYSNS